MMLCVKVDPQLDRLRQIRFQELLSRAQVCNHRVIDKVFTAGIIRREHKLESTQVLDEWTLTVGRVQAFQKRLAKT